MNADFHAKPLRKQPLVKNATVTQCSNIPKTKLSTIQNWYALKEMEVLFYPLPPNFWNSMAFRKVPRFCPFLLLIRAACRWRQLGDFVGIMLTGETRSKTRLSATLPTTVSHGLTWGRTHASVARSPKLTASAMARPLKQRRLVSSILEDLARAAH
jgi:hypothetical protein